jgi:hypothetical protein
LPDQRGSFGGLQEEELTGGGIETALGLGVSARKTRPLAIVGLIGFGAYLAGNALRHR